MHNYVISNRIRDWRIESEMSQEKLAELIGVSTRTLQAWEAGDGYPRLPMLISLADVMGVSIDYLTGRTTNWRINKAEEPKDLKESGP